MVLCFDCKTMQIPCKTIKPSNHPNQTIKPVLDMRERHNRVEPLALAQPLRSYSLHDQGRGDQSLSHMLVSVGQALGLSLGLDQCLDQGRPRYVGLRPRRAGLDQ